jgi:hypothetical protein
LLHGWVTWCALLQLSWEQLLLHMLLHLAGHALAKEPEQRPSGCSPHCSWLLLLALLLLLLLLSSLHCQLGPLSAKPFAGQVTSATLLALPGCWTAAAPADLSSCD